MTGAAAEPEPADDEHWPFSIVDRVRFGDLDAMRHLNKVEYLRFFETARIAYITELVPSDRKSTRLNSSHIQKSRMPSSA